jgi:hypothetical protein
MMAQQYDNTNRGTLGPQAPPVHSHSRRWSSAVSKTAPSTCSGTEGY